VIYAGNQDVRDEIEAIYRAEGIDIRLTPNVMPEINHFRIEVVNDDPLRKVKRTILKTPNTPLAYRRVEGKHGLAYDAENIKELERFRSGAMKRDLEAFLLGEYPDFRPGDDAFGGFVQHQDGRLDLGRYLDWLSANPHALPTRDEENAVRSFLAREIMAATTGRNLGYVKETDTYFLQYGVNFLNQPCTTLLIGGTIYHKCKAGGQFWRDLRLIAAGTHYNKAESWILRPQGKVLLDAAYMVSTLGGAIRLHRPPARHNAAPAAQEPR
jgi:hypothetical protein